jgi:hypothetical protein
VAVGSVIEYQFNFAAVSIIACQLQYVLLVGDVHGKDVVETVEVVNSELPCALIRNVDAMQHHFFDGSLIGLLSYVPMRSGSTVNLNIKAEKASLVFKYAFCHRAAADVAQAHGKYARNSHRY